jgi:hypothetical protein
MAAHSSMEAASVPMAAEIACCAEERISQSAGVRRRRSFAAGALGAVQSSGSSSTFRIRKIGAIFDVVQDDRRPVQR